MKLSPYAVASKDICEKIVKSSLKSDIHIERTKDLTTRMKNIIDEYYNCRKGTEYRHVYYNSLKKCGLLPINPKTGDYYIIRDASNMPDHCSASDIKILKSINRFYNNIRLLTGEKKKPEITEADLVHADTKLMLRVIRSRFVHNPELTDLLLKIEYLMKSFN